jgi:hypothetical protein
VRCLRFSSGCGVAGGGAGTAGAAGTGRDLVPLRRAVGCAERGVCGLGGAALNHTRSARGTRAGGQTPLPPGARLRAPPLRPPPPHQPQPPAKGIGFDRLRREICTEGRALRRLDPSAKPRGLPLGGVSAHALRARKGGQRASRVRREGSQGREQRRCEHGRACAGPVQGRGAGSIRFYGLRARAHALQEREAPVRVESEPPPRRARGRAARGACRRTARQRGAGAAGLRSGAAVLKPPREGSATPAARAARGGSSKGGSSVREGAVDQSGRGCRPVQQRGLHQSGRNSISTSSCAPSPSSRSTVLCM